MAAYLHGQLSGDRPRSNCWRVLRQAMLWAAVLDQQIDATDGQDGHPVVDVWYRSLIAMMRKPDALIWGAGNLGNGTDPPAFPPFTGCGLTEEGRRIAEQLLAAQPNGGSGAGPLRRSRTEETG
jgi:hypothetical protein